MRDRSFKRTAEGISVHISEGWPRRVEIRNGNYSATPEFFMDFQQAEGLMYALEAALMDARHFDRKEG